MARSVACSRMQAKEKQTREFDKVKMKWTRLFYCGQCECLGAKLNWLWWSTLWCFTVLAVSTRLYNIHKPKWICWDETHFGKMAGWYLNRTFFFDVHPPLGKMMISGVGRMTGYNGSFPFSKPGDLYETDMYVGMRVFCALLGSSIIPMSYCIVWELSTSLLAASTAALLLICDTGLLTLSRYILLDTPLLFFIMAATLCQLKFQRNCHRAFSYNWWLWLAFTGILLACAISVKFVGLFVVVLVGVTTARDLWIMLGDLSLSLCLIIKHLVARAVCLIALPVVVYMLFFGIHFIVLCKSGSGDGFFSSAFQSRLEGNALYQTNMPEEVAYGSVITVKNHRTGGVYLHSHSHLYPEGVGSMQQQQVTTYGHKDENNMWIVKPFDRDVEPTDDVVLVHNGDYLRLEHVQTGRNLHSHREVAPLTARHYQVTCYGENGAGDFNDVFRLDIVGGADRQPLKTARSVFRLVHVSTGCALHSHNKQLPKWGWQQLEVTCNPSIRNEKNLWNVEQVIDERLPNSSFDVYASGFLERFLESHAVMAQGNSDLKPNDGEVTSKPWQWPINYRGQPFSGGDYRVYLLGNPVIWWTNLLTLAVFVCISVCHSVKRQRGVKVTETSEQFVSAGNWLLCAWALHYVPFWAMGRVLYFHHYFPAFLYNTMLTGIVMARCLAVLLSAGVKYGCAILHHCAVIAVTIMIIYSFYLFSPLSYGMVGPTSQNSTSIMHGLQWLPSWDI